MEQIAPFSFEPLMTENELATHEHTIKQGKQAFIAVGKALHEINERRGYRFTHATFAEYVEQRWGMSISSGYDMMKAAQVLGNVQTSGQMGFSKAVSVGKLPAEQQQSFVDSHDIENMSVRETNQAVKEWEQKLQEAEKAKQEAEQRAKRAEEDLKKLNAQAADTYQQNKDLKKNLAEEVEKGIREQLAPAKESLRSEIEKELQKKFKDNIELLESTNEKLSKDADKLREYEQSKVWESAGARNEITRIMNRVYGDANKAFAEIETTFLEKLSPDINTAPVLEHIAKQFIEMGERIQSWLLPQYRNELVIEGDYVDV